MALRAHRSNQTAHKLETRIVYKDEDLVFCTDRGKPLANLKGLPKTFSDALTAAGCPQIRIHDLRHSYVALLIAQNANPKYIQRQLGHSSIQMTFDTYGHLMSEASRDTVEKLDLQVFGASP